MGPFSLLTLFGSGIRAPWRLAALNALFYRMRISSLSLILGALLAAPLSAQRGGHGGGYSSRSHASGVPRARSSSPRVRSAPRTASPRSPAIHHRGTPRLTTPGTRDSRGRLVRSREAKDDFMRSTGHPHGWPGHVVDHIKPLACGGADAPSNMQWQTTAEAKAKDRVERQGCGRH